MSLPKFDVYLGAKIKLREFFLTTYHTPGPCSVLDCFAGPEYVWGYLRAKYPWIRYWGVDLTPKKGRLAIDSLRILEQPGWDADIVDLDAYGSPWRHWEALLRTASGPKTVFLTIGVMKKAGGGSNYLSQVREWLGIPKNWQIPPSLGSSLADFSVDYGIFRFQHSPFKLVDLREAWPQAGARYLGLRLVPR